MTRYIVKWRDLKFMGWSCWDVVDVQEKRTVKSYDCSQDKRYDGKALATRTAERLSAGLPIETAKKKVERRV